MTQGKDIVPLSMVAPLTDTEQDDAAFLARDLAWAKVLEAFNFRQDAENLTYKSLGDRIGRSKSQVQRWLGSAFGMNIKSLGLLAEGMNSDLVIDIVPRGVALFANDAHPIEEARALIESRGGPALIMPENTAASAPKEKYYLVGV